eukprot:gene27622-34369_t
MGLCVLNVPLPTRSSHFSLDFLLHQNVGSNWFTSDFYATNNYYGFSDIASSSNGAIVACVSRNNGLWISWDYGMNFNNTVDKTGTNIHGSTIYFSDVTMSGDGTLQYSSVYGDYLYKSVDSGVNLYNFWNVVCSQSGQYVAAFNSNYPVGYNSIFVSTDYGVTFTIGLSLNSQQATFVYVQDLTMDGSGKNLAIATQGAGVLVSQNYGVNGSWFNNTVPVRTYEGNSITYSAITVDATGRYFVTMPSYGPSYTTHNYTYEENNDDSNMAEAIGFGLMGFGLGLIACMVVGIYVKEFVMTGRSITTLFNKPHPQHAIKRMNNQSKEPARLSEPLIADGRPADDVI